MPKCCDWRVQPFTRSRKWLSAGDARKWMENANITTGNTEKWTRRTVVHHRRRILETKRQTLNEQRTNKTLAANSILLVLLSANERRSMLTKLLHDLCTHSLLSLFNYYQSLVSSTFYDEPMFLNAFRAHKSTCSIHHRSINWLTNRNGVVVLFSL